GITHINAPCTHNMATTMATHRLPNSFDAVTSAYLVVTHMVRTVSSSFIRPSLRVVRSCTEQGSAGFPFSGIPENSSGKNLDAGLCCWILGSSACVLL